MYTIIVRFYAHLQNRQTLPKHLINGLFSQRVKSINIITLYYMQYIYKLFLKLYKINIVHSKLGWCKIVLEL